MQKDNQENSLIDRLGSRSENRLKTPYLQVLDEKDLVWGFNDILGDGFEFTGERWYNDTVFRVFVKGFTL